MKLFFKYAFINILRIPIRTVICIMIALVTTVVAVLCTDINNITGKAKEDFRNNYPTVATVSVKRIESPDGTQSFRGESLNLDDVMELSKSDSVEAYNISIHAGQLGNDVIITKLPDNSILESVPKDVILNDGNISVIAVNNLMLTEAFYSGDSVITEGREFSNVEMKGGSRAIVISKETSDKYGITVGDSVTVCMSNKSAYSLYRIVGIYISERGMTAAYIPLSDYLKDHTIFNQHEAYLNNLSVRFDNVLRLDFLLKSPEDATKFINDALDLGFDTSNHDITVNDKPYKTVSNSLDSICSMSETICVAVLVVGTVIFVLAAAFFAFSRSKETIVLNALGMKRRFINSMYVFEFVFIAIIAMITGVIGGSLLSRSAIHMIEKSYISQSVEDANKEKKSDEVHENRVLSLQREINVSLINGYVGIEGYVYPTSNKLPIESEAVRHDVFYTDNGVTNVTAVTQLSVEDFENKASLQRDICVSGHRLDGYSFECYVDERSQYKIGDVIRLYTQNPDESIVFTERDGKYVYVSAIYPDITLVVVGVYTEKQLSGIVMSMAELELLSDYSSVCSESYSDVRYDEIIGGDLGD